MSVLLSCNSLAKSFGAHLLFEGISLAFQDDERLGLIGPNGSGKSTLLKILAGLESADSGERIVTQGVKLGYLPQADRFTPGRTVLQTIIEAQADLALDPHERETEAGILLGKIGFANPHQAVDTLSGGWKKRLAIATALVRKPDLLLLDEPTNHLDVEGILWLESFLKASRQAFVVVTHDRYFLENVAGRIVELDRRYPQGFFSVPGNYSAFLERRADYFASQQSYAESVANKVRREVEWLRRKAPARTTKARARIDEAGRLQDELKDLKARTGGPRQAGIDFTATQRKTKELVVVEGVAKARGGRTLFKELTFTLTPGMRLGILGANGAGKTTLLRLLAGEDEPDAGALRRASDLQVVRFDQSREQLDPNVSLRQALTPAGGDAVIFRGESVHVAAWAKRFLFRPDQLESKVGGLSGGEQARLLIARLMLRPADVLLLDEPTNDLDIPTLELLEESLASFPGALVLVTHDRFMLDRVSTIVLGIDGEGGATFYADFAQWREAEEAREGERAKAERARETPKAPAAPAPSSPKPKKLSYMEQREWDGMEARILEAEEKLAAAQAQLNDPAHAADSGRLLAFTQEVAAAQAEVDRLYARWAELEAKLS